MVRKGIIFQVFFSLLFTGNLLHAQEAVKDEKSFYNANLLVLYHKYEAALPLYLKLADKYPANSNLQYLTGTCYLHIPGQKTRAISYLEKASQDVSRKYKKDLYQETRAPLEALLFLGRAYQIHNELDKALSAYSRYKKMLRKRQSKDIVNRWIGSCELAKKMMSRPGDVEMVYPELLKVGRIVYHPALSGDKKRMVFMSETKYYQAIYFTEFQNGAWTTPENITMEIESDGTYQVASLNYEGTLLLLTVPRKEHRDIFISKYKNNVWEKAIPLEGKVNTLHDEVFASLSPDGHKLYFVSDRSGGPGGLDIFTASLTPEGKWDNILPLPGPVNTPYNEQSPVLASDGQQLFFSSDGHPGMGGYDIFSSKQKNEIWNDPVNLGYPPNSTDDDLYFAPLDSGFKGYITHWFNEQEKRAYIATVERYTPEHPRPVVLSGKLILPPGYNLPEDINIKIENTAVKVPATGSIHITREGTFETKLPAGTYRITVNGKKLSPFAQVIALQKEDHTKRIELPLTFAAPATAEKKEMYVVSPVYFDFDKFTLTTAARLKLDKLADILKVFPGVRVSVEGHTDAIGPCSYNRKLSLKRSQAVKNYLVSKGITSSRLTATAYGESKPVAINRNLDGTDNPRGRHYNRRVEFGIKGNGADQIRVKQNIPPELLFNK